MLQTADMNDVIDEIWNAIDNSDRESNESIEKPNITLSSKGQAEKKEQSKNSMNKQIWGVYQK